MKKSLFLIGTTCLVLLAGCGTVTTVAPTTPTTTTTSKISPKDITIKDFQFSPATIEITIGESAQWINNDNAPHQIVADDNSFQSPTLQAGESFSFTFTQAGNFSYHCQIHPSMKGTITVK